MAGKWRDLTPVTAHAAPQVLEVLMHCPGSGVGVAIYDAVHAGRIEDARALFERTGAVSALAAA